MFINVWFDELMRRKEIGVVCVGDCVVFIKKCLKNIGVSRE